MLTQFSEECRAVDELRWQVRSHERDALFLTGALEMGGERLPLVLEIEKVGLPHPTGKAVVLKLSVRHSFDGVHAHPPLSSVAPFFPADSRHKSCWRHDEDEEIHSVQRLLDLLPPADAALHASPIVPDANFRLFYLEPLSQPASELLTILASVGYEDSGKSRHHGITEGWDGRMWSLRPRQPVHSLSGDRHVSVSL